MRSRTAALIAAALAAPALAQSAAVSLTHDDADGEINLGETVTWTLSVAFTGFGNGSAVSFMSSAIEATDPTVATSSAMTYSAFRRFSGGLSDGNGGIESVSFYNWVSLVEWESPSIVLRDNPLTVGTFTTTGLAAGELTYNLSTLEGESRFVEVQISDFASTFFGVNDVTFDIDTLTIVPAPASALLLAPAGLLATRRRR